LTIDDAAQVPNHPRIEEDPEPVRSAVFERVKAAEYRIGKIELLRHIGKTNPEYVVWTERAIQSTMKRSMGSLF
jgi:hypothetical protein